MLAAHNSKHGISKIMTEKNIKKDKHVNAQNITYTQIEAHSLLLIY